MQQQIREDSRHPCWQLLLPHHADLPRASTIAPAVIEARGYRSIDVKARLKALGFTPAQCRVPALLIPFYGVDGELVTYQIRPDEPRLNSDGKSIKYETVAGSRMALDVPKLARSWLADPAWPLFITEGVRKADAAVSKDLCCIALLGVWNWRGTNEHGGKTALPDWESIALNGRDVYVVFDSDVMVKRPVYQALARLKGFLEHKGAHVWLIHLTTGDGGAKVGLDDYFAAGRSVQDLLALATAELREPPADDPPKHSIPYRATPQGLVWLKSVHDGVVSVPLTNFIATIVTDILEDDGVEVRRRFEIETTFNGRTRHFAIPADRLRACLIICLATSRGVT